jgi:hypothetical protein
MTLATSSHCLRCSPHGRRLQQMLITTRMRSPRRVYAHHGVLSPQGLRQRAP